MSEHILELWEQQHGRALPRDVRQPAKSAVPRTFRERVRALRQAAERRIDDWIGELDDAQTRPDRDF